jgi:drug/metabolite transporter (DMT)-like permease
LPFFLITFGEIYVSSSLAAIVNSTTPICTAILAHFFVANERINWNKGLGILLGFVGIVVVFAPTLLDREPDSEFGAFLVLLAAMSYALGMVYSKKNFHGIPPMVGASAQLIAATLMLAPLALVTEQPYLLPAPSWTAIGGVCGLAVLGTATAFPLFYTVVKLAGPTALSTTTLLFPVIGIFLGVVLLDEEVGLNAYLGSAMILSGLAIANNLVRIRIGPYTSHRP